MSRIVFSTRSPTASSPPLPLIPHVRLPLFRVHLQHHPQPHLQALSQSSALKNETKIIITVKQPDNKVNTYSERCIQWWLQDSSFLHEFKRTRFWNLPNLNVLILRLFWIGASPSPCGDYWVPKGRSVKLPLVLMSHSKPLRKDLSKDFSSLIRLFSSKWYS